MNAQVMTPNEIASKFSFRAWARLAWFAFSSKAKQVGVTTLKNAVNGWAIRRWQKSGRIFSG